MKEIAIILIFILKKTLLSEKTTAKHLKYRKIYKHLNFSVLFFVYCFLVFLLVSKCLWKLTGSYCILPFKINAQYIFFLTAFVSTFDQRKCVASTFLWFEPIEAPDKQARVFLYSFSYFPEILEFFKKLRCVHCIVESITAVCITLLSQSLQCASHCNSNSGVCITPLRCASYCEDIQIFKKPHSVHHIAKSDWHCGINLSKFLSSQEHRQVNHPAVYHRGDRLGGVMHIAEIVSL